MIQFNKEKAYTTDEAAAILQRRPITIRRYIKDGKLRAQMISNAYYIPESSLKDFAKERG